jgi:hypothetical protein
MELDPDATERPGPADARIRKGRDRYRDLRDPTKPKTPPESTVTAGRDRYRTKRARHATYDN